MARLREIVFDCGRAPALARFRAAVPDGYRVRPCDAAEIARLAALGLTPETDPTVMPRGCPRGDGPRAGAAALLPAGAAPAPRCAPPGQPRPSRRGRGAAEVRRLAALGAAVVREADGYVVMADPEGNRFCVVGPVGS